jgi:drug/metabolite transporter, DME family
LNNQINFRNKGILYTVIAALLWSTGGLFVKLLPQDAFTILFYRSFYTCIFFIVVFQKKLLNINKYSFYSAALYAPLMICFVTSTKLTTAANAIFLQATGVAYVLLLEPIFLRTKLLRLDILTVIFCFIGMSFFLIDGFEFSATNPGIYIAMLSGLASAGVMLTQKKNTDEYRLSGIVMGNILVMLITLPFFLKNPLPTIQENAMFMFLGFVQLGIGFVLFVIGQRYIPAVESAMISLLEPVFNPIWVMIGYGEVPGLLPMVGGLIIVLALLMRLLAFGKFNIVKNR